MYRTISKVLCRDFFVCLLEPKTCTELPPCFWHWNHLSIVSVVLKISTWIRFDLIWKWQMELVNEKKTFINSFRKLKLLIFEDYVKRWLEIILHLKCCIFCEWFRFLFKITTFCHNNTNRIIARVNDIYTMYTYRIIKNRVNSVYMAYGEISLPK